MNKELGQRILQLRERVVSNFDAGDWEEVGLLTGKSEMIGRHPRSVPKVGRAEMSAIAVA